MHTRYIGLAASLLLAGPALAGGMDVGEHGARATGRGGAFTAKADDPSAIDNNPAGLAKQRGTHFYICGRVLYGPVEYRRARTLDWSGVTEGGVPSLVDFEHTHNEAPWFPINGMIVAQSDFGLEDWTFAVGVYGPPGVGYVEYPGEGAQRFTLTEMEVTILYYTAAAAWKYNDLFGLGLSLQWVDVPTLNFEMVTDGNVAPKLVNPVQSDFEINTRVEAADRIGFTAIVGAWLKPIPQLEVAVAGRVIPVPVEAEGTLALRALYLNLPDGIRTTRNGEPADDVTFKMLLPPKLRAGVRYSHKDGKREVFDIELGVHYELWSLIDKYEMEMNIRSEVAGQIIDIGTIDIDKKWHDTIAVRLGGDYNVVPDWLTLRAGFFYETGAEPKGYAYLDVMSLERISPSAGFTLAHWGFELSAAYTYVWQKPMVVTEEESRVYQQMPAGQCKAPYTNPNLCHPEYIGKPAAPANAGTYISDYHIITFALSYGF